MRSDDIAAFLGDGIPDREEGCRTPGLRIVDLEHTQRNRELLRALNTLPSYRPRPILVGHATKMLTQEQVSLAKHLDFTVAPGGPGRTWVPAGVVDLEITAASISKAPMAAAALALHLRTSEELAAEHALIQESTTYSTLLASDEFDTWLRTRPTRSSASARDPVEYTRHGNTLIITLNEPERHNAFSSHIRDGTLAALAVADHDDTIDAIHLHGAGGSFCSGGDLAEFGFTTSAVQGHLIRMQHSVGGAVHRHSSKVTAHLHGACIGAGAEIPAFAGRVLATPDTVFRLPELSMGLIPGAGGTVSLPRRIGRWRTAALAMSGVTLDVATAEEWGLVDELIP